MITVTLGKTGITVDKNGFGALPIQRISIDDAAFILQKAYNNGIRFFDTARAYTDSEMKLNKALKPFPRESFYIASKTQATTAENFWKDLNTSLEQLGMDYIDLYQFHNTPFCPRPGDGTGLYEAMLEARDKGLIRHIGITNHRMGIASEIIDSGLYETLMFPFSYLSSDEDIDLVRRCKEKNMGFIAMKGLSGGVINNARAAFAFMAQFDNVLPIWGCQRERELDEFIACQTDPPQMAGEIKDLIEADRKELSGIFCRGCGYCMPCPVGIKINDCTRAILFMKRAPFEKRLGIEFQKEMEKIENCLHCNKCKSKCPYGLDVPTLLRQNLEDYRKVLKGEIFVGVSADVLRNKR
ncbi:MAG: aldo/keto reductase [Spirochaetales bacterium]|nr:aldo/keto reductase [Spirochaetales bacterium]